MARRSKYTCRLERSGRRLVNDRWTLSIRSDIRCGDRIFLAYSTGGRCMFEKRAHEIMYIMG